MESTLLGINFELTAAVVAVSAAISTALKYIEVAVRLSKENPKKMAGGLLGGAWYFAYNMLSLQFQFVPKTNEEVFYRWCFSFAAISMALGPFLLFTPTRPVVLKKDTLFKQLVIGAQKKETRYATLAVFFCLTILQGIVVYALYVVLNDILQAELRLTLGACVGYALVSVLYLVVFYSVMMRKPFVIKGIDFMEVFRRKMVFTKQDGTTIDVLNHKHYVKLYLLLFIAFLGLCIYIVASLFAMDLSNLDRSNTVHMLVVGSYFSLDVISIIVLTIFILNVAFHPLNVATEAVLEDGSIIDLSQIRFFAVARSNDRTLLCRHALRGDPKSGEIEEKVLHEIDTAPVQPGYRHTTEDVQSNVALHQSNDAKCMFFLATGVLYDRDVALYFLDEAQAHTEQTFYRFAGLDTYGINSWAAALEPFLASSFTKFSHKDSMQQLRNEAKERVREKEQSAEDEANFELNVKKCESEMNELMAQIKEKKNFFPELESTRLAARATRLAKIRPSVYVVPDPFDYELTKSLEDGSDFDGATGGGGGGDSFRLRDSAVRLQRIQCELEEEELEEEIGALVRGQTEQIEKGVNELRMASVSRRPGIGSRIRQIAQPQLFGSSAPPPPPSAVAPTDPDTQQVLKMAEQAQSDAINALQRALQVSSDATAIGMEVRHELNQQTQKIEKMEVRTQRSGGGKKKKMMEKEMVPLRAMDKKERVDIRKPQPRRNVQLEDLKSTSTRMPPPPPQPARQQRQQHAQIPAISPPPPPTASSQLSTIPSASSVAKSPVARRPIAGPPTQAPHLNLKGSVLPPPAAPRPLSTSVSRRSSSSAAQPLPTTAAVEKKKLIAPTRAEIAPSAVKFDGARRRRSPDSFHRDRSLSVSQAPSTLSSTQPKLGPTQDALPTSHAAESDDFVGFSAMFNEGGLVPPSAEHEEDIFTSSLPPQSQEDNLIIQPLFDFETPPAPSTDTFQPSPPPPPPPGWKPIRRSPIPLPPPTPPTVILEPRAVTVEHVIQIDPDISNKFQSVEVELLALSSKISQVEKWVRTSQSELLFSQGSNDKDMIVRADPSGRCLSSDGVANDALFGLSTSVGGHTQQLASPLPLFSFPLVTSDRPINRFTESPTIVEFTLRSESSEAPMSVALGFASRLIGSATVRPIVEYCSWNGVALPFENENKASLVGLPLVSGDTLSMCVDFANQCFLFAKNGAFCGCVRLSSHDGVRWDLASEIYLSVRFCTPKASVSVVSDQNKLTYRQAFGSERIAPFTTRDMCSLYFTACSPTILGALSTLADTVTQQMNVCDDPPHGAILLHEGVAWVQQRQSTFLRFAIDYLLFGKRKLSPYQQRVLQSTVTTGLAFLYSRAQHAGSADQSILISHKLLAEFISVFSWPVQPSPSAACAFIQACQNRAIELKKTSKGVCSPFHERLVDSTASALVEICSAIASTLSQSP